MLAGGDYVCYSLFMALILSGTRAQEARVSYLQKKVDTLSRKPCLAIIQVGSISESTVYINQKKKMGLLVGIEVRHVSLPESISFDELVSQIQKNNTDSSVDGIIVQLPLPQYLDKQAVIEAIDPIKDADGLTLTNQTALQAGLSGIPIPATARGVLSLLQHYNIPVKGRRVVVLGRSALVGAPVAKLVELAGATVTVCHSKTLNTKEVTRNADIVIVAIGKKHFVTKDFVSSGQVIVDVGINAGTREDKTRVLMGDVAYEEVLPFVSAITPVPGGVGPMTVVSLFENVLEIALKRDILTK